MTSITQSFSEVRARFESLCGDAHSRCHHKNAEPEATQEQLRDCFERFQLWAGNAGASKPWRDPLSLDSRVKHAPEVGNRIAEILRDLIDLLDNGMHSAEASRSMLMFNIQ